MKTVKATVHTELITSDDGKHTFEVIKRLEGVQGECGFIISLYPTRCENNIYNSDSTLNHLVGHLTDLGLNELHIINLYSKVVNGKMSVRGLQIDNDNMNYIDGLMADKKFQSSRFIIAWGNSFSTSKAITDSKVKILNMFLKHNPKGKLYQLCLIGKSLESDTVPHPLYLGINGANAKWGLKEFKLTAKDLKAINDDKTPKQCK